MARPGPEGTPRPALPPLPGAGRWRGLRIGLLGGSFNPAHEGHVEISLTALKRLRLDHVWWLISPQNPLKDTRETAPLDTRLARARRMARHPRLKVMALERRLATAYTADTLAFLLRRLPQTRFVWLMGADNLAQFSTWRNWTGIARMVPFAIFDRPGYSMSAVSSKAARRFVGARLPESRAGCLADLAPPAWVFCHGRRNPLSSTALRKQSF